MKILYSIQATGNGHIARAMELMPYLQQYGQVDVFLSGSNSNLQPDLPVKYRSRGVSLFYGNTGGLDYLRMWKEFSLKRIWKEAKDLPVEQYDIVLNDFESITALACRLKKVPSVGFGHQASFRSRFTPRSAKKDMAGEIVLQHYATASDYVGLHFKSYDSFIVSPVIKQQILQADAADKGHITVYLSHYSDEVVIKALQKIKEIRFEVFSKKVRAITAHGNITLIPVSNDAFTRSLIHSHGVITGAGFETPAEALYLGKQLLCLPIKGQYEQLCNAAALKDFNVTVVDKIDESFAAHVQHWLQHSAVTPLALAQDTRQIVQLAMDKGRELKHQFTVHEPLLTEEDLAVMYP
ncbi:glycosyltransferase family protein [Sediminibacterium soli]|uniref:glycosyltransferase family protein n=1 Tax=Sediminibacterium soli TaxID=2698829 RepID=UPI001379EC9A|nr:glycosyltransferase family protein [Sediminibacterium soli]NCI47674.1 glycosyl transferase [Sediminibacterium soli]